MIYMLTLCCLSTALYPVCEAVLSGRASLQAKVSIVSILSTDKNSVARAILTKYYITLIKSENIRSELLSGSLLADPNVPPQIIESLAMRWHKNGLRQCYELLYQIREQWWNNNELRRKLIELINVRYAAFRYEHYLKVPTERLNYYTDMILCYAYCNCMTNAIGLYQLLNDKRIVCDFSSYPLTGHHLPLPSRVCDHALMALFTLYEIDVSIVSRRYGYPMMFPNERNPQYYVEKAFDAMIRDWPRLRVKFPQIPKP